MASRTAPANFGGHPLRSRMPQTVLRHSLTLSMDSLLDKTTRSMKRTCVRIEGLDFPFMTSRIMDSHISVRNVISTGPGITKKRTLLDTLQLADSAFAIDLSRTARPKSSKLSSKDAPPRNKPTPTLPPPPQFCSTNQPLLTMMPTPALTLKPCLRERMSLPSWMPWPLSG